MVVYLTSLMMLLIRHWILSILKLWYVLDDHQVHVTFTCISNNIDLNIKKKQETKNCASYAWLP